MSDNVLVLRLNGRFIMLIYYNVNYKLLFITYMLHIFFNVSNIT